MNENTVSRRVFLKALGLGACGLAVRRPLAAQNLNAKSDKLHRPNFIFFFTDDQGWGDLGCYGHPYLKTPNLDRLAKEGTRFEQFYSSASVCSPSRTAFMTGHYPARHHIHRHLSNHGHNKHNKMPDWLDPKAATVTRLVRKGGYRVGHFGKWHLGHVNGAPEPGAYGIDEYRTLVGTGPGWDRDGKPAKKDLVITSYNTCTSKDRFWTHSMDLIVDQAIAFLEKNKGKPFYLNVWAILPHAPNRPTPEQLAEYKNLKADPRDFKSWMRGYAKDAKNLEQQMKNYCAVMGHIDSAVGRLLGKLDELKLANDTLVFMTSDNGPEDYHIGNVRNSGMGSTGVLRGRKRSLYEGGVRMPCIARWPGVVPAGKADKASVLGAVDWLPTVCSLAGVPTPNIKPDGEDISDILRGKHRARKRPLFWEWRAGVVGNRAYKPPALAIRDGNWKLYANPDGTRQELYDIPKDPEERTNLRARNPEVAARLLAKLLEWKKTLPK
ncbi:MAG: sulfatase-like hydrolase/transferase [Phycisphaerae bacterium]|nr:sulfatase-like hydrolase/transferase [Phycisphaerae bacterium]